jgi:hypothetical protein
MYLYPVGCLKLAFRRIVARRRLPAVKRTATMPGCFDRKKTNQFALLNCTQPLRGKSQAIEHNRALPKVGQSLRGLRFVAYRCAPCGFG